MCPWEISLTLSENTFYIFKLSQIFSQRIDEKMHVNSIIQKRCSVDYYYALFKTYPCDSGKIKTIPYNLV